MDRRECPGDMMLSAHLDDELNATQRAAVQAHLRVCDFCASQVAEMRELSLALRSSRAAIPPIDVVEQVRWRIAEHALGRGRRRAAIGLVPLALAASIVLGIGVTLGSRLANPLPTADVSTAARLAPFGAVPPGNVCLNYPSCYRR